MRRTGGHGGPGCAWIHSNRVKTGRYDSRNAIDVVPSLLDLVNEQSSVNLSGQSMLDQIRL